MAASRLGAVTTSLASMGSKSGVTVTPSLIPDSMRTPCPSGQRSRVTVPVEGIMPLAGSSQVMRNSKEWARGAGASAMGSPEAMRSCCSTRSRPVTSSETVCSTWSRGLTSRKLTHPSPSTRNSHVPRPTYPTASKSRLDQSTRVSSTPSGRAGAGASSMSFWLRRCTEQSRVEITAKLPWESRAHWVSTWRAVRMNRSTKNPSVSCPWAAKKRSRSSSDSMTVMPRPPPPSAFFVTIGYPLAATKSSTRVREVTGPEIPATGATSTDSASRRALILSPRASRTCGEGPIQTIPASRTAWAKPGISERNP